MSPHSRLLKAIEVNPVIAKSEQTVKKLVLYCFMLKMQKGTSSAAQ